MAHESFEDQAVAEVMNEHFISVKVEAILASGAMIYLADTLLGPNPGRPRREAGHR